MSLKRRMFMYHRRVVDPAERGPGLAAMRLLLALPAMLYGAAVRLRNALYDHGLKRVHAADVPVLSVGNITAGGTGKTPLVEWVGRLLTIHKRRPAVLSRGYGANPETGLDDENELLARAVPGALLFARPDRVSAAADAVAAGADVIVLDDGFQHRRMGRDLDVVLLDATRPFGGGWMLPRGSLREPLSGLRRADHIVLTRCDLLPEEELERVRRRVAHRAPGVPVTCCSMEAAGLRPLAGAPTLERSELTRGDWGAFCGIGNPEGFRGTLRRAGCTPAVFTAFADHERYTREQVAQVLESCRQAGCRAVVCTEKDAVKVEGLLPDACRPPVYALGIELEFGKGRDTLVAAILALVGREMKSCTRTGPARSQSSSASENARRT